MKRCRKSPKTKQNKPRAITTKNHPKKKETPIRNVKTHQKNNQEPFTIDLKIQKKQEQKHIPRPKEWFLVGFMYLKTNQKAYLWGSWYLKKILRGPRPNSPLPKSKARFSSNSWKRGVGFSSCFLAKPRQPGDASGRPIGRRGFGRFW